VHPPTVHEAGLQFDQLTVHAEPFHLNNCALYPGIAANKPFAKA
jgi:hypothetical protein